MPASNYDREILLRLIDLSETIFRRERALEDALGTRDISLVGDQMHDLICQYLGIPPDGDGTLEVIYSGRTREQKIDDLLEMAGHEI